LYYVFQFFFSNHSQFKPISGILAIISHLILQPQIFFFELPIYFKIAITSDNREDFFILILETKSIDGYNPVLKENTTYNIKYIVQKYMPEGKFELSSYEGFLKYN